jgi:hypothetical protein
MEKSECIGPQAVMYTDASCKGWGAVIVTEKTVRTIAREWTIQQREQFNLNLSATTEPLAVILAAAATMTPQFRSVAIITDHEPLFLAIQHGSANSYMYNRVCEFFHKNYPQTEIQCQFIEGIKNPADKPSREGKYADTTEKIDHACETTKAITQNILKTCEHGKTGTHQYLQEWVQTASKPTRPRILQCMSSQKNSFSSP